MGGPQYSGVMRWTRCAALAWAVVLGCATAPSKPVMEFPAAASIAAIAQRPARVELPETGEVPAEGWVLEGGAAVAGRPDEPWQPEHPNEQTMAADVRELRGSVFLSKALSCVAREAGRFVLKTGGAPPEEMRQFFVAACGGVVPDVGLYWVSADTASSTPDDQVFARFRARLREDSRRQEAARPGYRGRILVRAQRSSRPRHRVVRDSAGTTG